MRDESQVLLVGVDNELLEFSAIFHSSLILKDIECSVPWSSWEDRLGLPQSQESRPALQPCERGNTVALQAWLGPSHELDEGYLPVR